jgi:hypothetical protein
MVKRSCGDFFCNFWKVARGIFGNISKTRGLPRIFGTAA